MSRGIVWTAEEKEKVAKRAFEIRGENPLSGTDLHCVRTAMKELLVSIRHRNIHQMKDVQPWLSEYWTALTAAQSKEETLELLTTFSAYEPAIKPLVVPQIEREVAVPPTNQTNSRLSDLWAELGRRIEEATSGERIKAIIRTEINATLERRLPGILAPDDVQTPVEQPHQKERKHKLKICVIGLLNSQHELVKNEYRDTVDFLAFDKTPSFSRIQSTARHYDYVVQMLKYSNQIKGANKIDNFHMCGGLLTQLREFVNRKLEKHGAQ
jgi:hypothetical protein